MKKKSRRSRRNKNNGSKEQFSFSVLKIKKKTTCYLLTKNTRALYSRVDN